MAYDSSKALSLLSDRGTLPKPFGVADDVLNPKTVVGRTAPVFKPKSNAELMQNSRTDEG